MINEADVQDGDEIRIIWGQAGGAASKPFVPPHVLTEIRATVSSRPPR
jgi:hypothetical protein